MPLSSWIYRILGSRNDIIKIVIWEAIVVILLILYRVLGYIVLGH